MLNTEFQYFKGNVTNLTPTGKITLKQFIKAQKNPKDSLKDVFNLISEATINGDLKLKKKLKEENLFYFTPCVNLSRRYYSGIDKFTGLLVLDFDGIDNAVEFRDFIFESCPYMVSCWTSPSKKGVKALIKIPVVETVEEFKEYFFGLSYYMCCYNGFDISAQCPILPLFISWDEGIKWRNDAKTWIYRGDKKNSFKIPEAEIKEINTIATEADIKEIDDIITSVMRSIVDNAHPQLRSLSLLIGGYVAAGYLTHEEAFEKIKEEILNNDYIMSGGIIQDRLKVTEWGLIQGSKSPLLLEKKL